MKNTSAFKVSGILCPVDFSDLSNLALKYAAAGAKAYNAKLIVLHAERFEMPAYFTAAQVDALAGQLADARSGARNYLEQRTHAILGPLADALAHKLKADLVVLGAQRRGSAMDSLFGSTTEHVLRQAPVPVLVVPNPAKD